MEGDCTGGEPVAPAKAASEGNEGADLPHLH